ncbi:hypothetical protein BDQ94DRAFT_138173 [Aspergillus welwitschiae]|uniref:Uncharacterized protein n=1 Tax=Aspergillus welwitschiae TaxID=1341132 RepID=A0A3F3QBX3_9EURO|nr:hypothetical protein BDQ94DRAFT_138173 [Aspergillus welwitschiae]RDH36627.1 hypothetical protein BDQ94DRAFT_138173 [Aspergillus welwitschiae]
MYGLDDLILKLRSGLVQCRNGCSTWYHLRWKSIFKLIAMRESLDRGNLSCGWSGPVIASPRWMLGYYEDYWVSGECIISVIVLVSVWSECLSWVQRGFEIETETEISR